MDNKNFIIDGTVLSMCGRNPMSAHRVSRISLSPDVVDCIVLRLKNPAHEANLEAQIEKLNAHKEKLGDKIEFYKKEILKKS